LTKLTSPPRPGSNSLASGPGEGRSILHSGPPKFRRPARSGTQDHPGLSRITGINRVHHTNELHVRVTRLTPVCPTCQCATGPPHHATPSSDTAATQQRHSFEPRSRPHGTHAPTHASAAAAWEGWTDIDT